MIDLQRLKILLSKAAEDDSNAFREIYDDFYIPVYRFASYYVKSEEIREEIVSDVFFTLWQNRGKNTEIKDFKAYLYITTKNRALYYINKSDDLTIAIDDIPLGIVSHESTPEEMLINEELNDAIMEAIEELPERCKLIFLMAKEEELKYKEIAEILSISEKTVNAQMVIAFKKLSLKLRKYMHLLLI